MNILYRQVVVAFLIDEIQAFGDLFDFESSHKNY